MTLARTAKDRTDDATNVQDEAYYMGVLDGVAASLAVVLRYLREL